MLTRYANSAWSEPIAITEERGDLFKPAVAVDGTWRDEKPNAGKQSYYYVRGEQQDGEIVWALPLWITYRGR